MSRLIYDDIEVSTEKAICFSFDNQNVWLPKSQIEHLDMHGHFVDIPQWLILSKGLECYCMDEYEGVLDG